MKNKKFVEVSPEMLAMLIKKAYGEEDFRQDHELMIRMNERCEREVQKVLKNA